MRVNDLVEKARAKNAKRGKYPDVTVKALKKMPNQEFVGEIVAAGRAMIKNRWQGWEPEEQAFMIVECVTCKKTLQSSAKNHPPYSSN